MGFRLREEGHVFSEVPTEQEIKDAKNKYELAKELEEIDRYLVISHSRRKIDTDSISSMNDSKSSSSSSSIVVVVKEELKFVGTVVNKEKDTEKTVPSHALQVASSTKVDHPVAAPKVVVSADDDEEAEF